MADFAAEVRDVRVAQAEQEDWAVASSWSDAAGLWEHLRGNTNIVRAAEQLDWGTLCPPNATVLDLGCGAGWLAAMLSKEPRVDRVLAWDGSLALLTGLLPETVRLVGGEPQKIEPVCGDFLPLLIEDRSVDLVAMSSAFHHSDRPEQLLGELARVVSPGGLVVLLNETPWHPLAVLSFATRTYGAVLSGLLGRVRRREGHIGYNHVLYDEKLGDRAYSMRAWRQMAADTGWAIEVRDTGMPSYQPHHRPRGRLEPNLFHFVLRRVGEPAARK